MDSADIDAALTMTCGLFFAAIASASASLFAVRPTTPRYVNIKRFHPST